MVMDRQDVAKIRHTDVNVSCTKRSTVLFATLFATVFGSVTTSIFGSSLATAATASPGDAAAASVMLDPHPGPPCVFSGYRFGSDGACSAAGRAWVNSGRYKDWTCRYEEGSYLLYLEPATELPCFSVGVASLPSRLAARCG